MDNPLSCFGLLFFYALVFLSFSCFGQFSEQFSDGDFNTSPQWKGIENSFIVNENYQLQLNAQESGSAYLSTPSKAINNAFWKFYIELGFNPSSNNYAKVYLVSDSPDLQQSLQGYFIMVGGGEDEVSLYRQVGTTAIRIIDGTDNRLDKSEVKVNIKVFRSDKGKWELWSAVDDTTTYYKEGEAEDTTLLNTAYFGLLCQYTSTRADKFFFDNIEVSGEPFVDSIPPELVSLQIPSSSSLEVAFSEPLSASSAETIENYQLSPEAGHPRVATFKESSKDVIMLSFDQSLKNGTNYTLKIENLTDTVGNTIKPISYSFLFYMEEEPHYRDIVINELMVSPSPAVGLPEAEFIELFNISEKIFNLSQWKISDENTSSPLKEDYLIRPGEYLILCAQKDTVLFRAYGNILGISPWPSLNNGGDVVRLTWSDNSVIDEVAYTDKWYKSSIRGAGGYTLEMIDPFNPCSGEENWKVSEGRDGGTPGKPNAVFASKPDLKGPELIQVFPVSPEVLRLTCNERLDTAGIKYAEYLLSDTPEVTEAVAGDSPSVIFLFLDTPLETDKAYSLIVNNLKDCNGNLINPESNTFTFGLPQSPDSADVIINEVLFNPRPAGVDFVEVFNNSAKYFNLRNWTLANVSLEDETGLEVIDNRYPVIKEDFLFGPGEWLALTTSIDKTLMHYPQSISNPMVQMEEFPGYNNAEGTVILLNPENMVMDRFDYQDEYHSAILQITEGVSLERIAFKSPTQDPQNWASAASTVSFGTPGESNSQSRRLSTIEGEILVDPKIITPDNDGHIDFTTIQYLFRNQGYIASIYVYDAGGRMIRKIIENASLATQGFVTWDGTDDNGRKVNVGIYMIYLEIFNLNGEAKTFKEPIAIGSKF